MTSEHRPGRAPRLATDLGRPDGSPQGRLRIALWQCNDDLTWSPNREERCRKCGKPRPIARDDTRPIGTPWGER